LTFIGVVGFALSASADESRVSEQPARPIFDNVTDEQFCEMMKKDAEDTTREAPIQVDWTTRVEGMAVSCVQRQVTFNKSVSMDPSSLKPGWREGYQRGHDQTTCQNGLFATMTRRGWRMAQFVTFANGEYVRFETVECPSA
jgi:hypothetical protein